LRVDQVTTAWQHQQQAIVVEAEGQLAVQIIWPAGKDGAVSCAF
jgi:hypothetical protein